MLSGSFSCRKYISRVLIIAALLLLNACTGVPDGMQPVTGFELNRYLGKWYEIARLDHSFERGLDHVTAEYAMSDDGGVVVLNRGYSAEEKKWQQAEGKAYFVGSSDEGYLKVSFFGPFYGAYVIFELDEAYQYAFVVGPDRSYLWLLSRTPEVSPELIRDFKARVKALGFKSETLIMVAQRTDKS